MVGYRENTALCQSQLKLLLVHPLLFNSVEEPNLYYEEKKHFILGNGVDIQLTQDLETYKEEFHISEVENKPSDAIKSILNMAFDTIKVLREDEEVEIITSPRYKTYILEALESHAYQPKWKEDTKYSKMCEWYEYWDDLRESTGKKIVSAEEDALISEIVVSLKTNVATAPYFQKSRHEEMYYQKEIYFEYEGLDCKALLDIMKIDNDAHTIQPLDVKTLGDSTMNFSMSLRKRRYDIQAAFYVEAIKAWKEVNGYSGYTILPFKFLVESTKTPGTPLVFTCSSELEYIGRYGRPEGYVEQHSTIDHLGLVKIRYKEILGFTQLIELYRYYTEHGFEIDQKVREHSSEFIIDWSGIIV